MLTIWAYLLLPLLMAIGAWVAFAFHKNRLTPVPSGLTFVPLVLPLFLVCIANLIGPKVAPTLILVLCMIFNAWDYQEYTNS